MRTAFVVVCHPCFRQFSHIMEGAEDVCIKHRPAVASVEAFDYAVLSWMAWLDIDDVYIVAFAPLRNVLDMNSGPLSHRMFFGFPLSQITFSSNLMTLSAGIDMDISYPTATLSQSSMIFSTRNVLPLCSLSLTKSIDHVVFGSDGITRGLLTRAGSLFFSLLRFS